MSWTNEFIAPEERTIIAADNLKEALWKARGREPNGNLCPCPPGCANEHEDSNPSFNVRVVNNKLLFKCFSSCDQQEALQALIDNGWWKQSDDGEWDTAYEDMARANGIGLAEDGPNYWENDMAATHNYLYKDEDSYFFMDLKTFDQVEIRKEIVGEKGKLLSENLQVSISFYNENPISIELPNQVTCKIETTDVALKGQTVSSSYKPATLDNGINIQVPPFIESGDTIIVDTRTIEYVKKI